KAAISAPVETESVSATLPALQSLLSGALKAVGSRHIILLAAGEFTSSPQMEVLTNAAVRNSVAIHAVAVGDPHPALREICQRTGGMILTAASADELAAAYRNMYLALSHVYRIRFLPSAGEARLEVYCGAGHGECKLN